MSKIKAHYATELLTGIRPTGDLTVANYLGAVAPIVAMQEQGVKPLVFVADLHAMTDKEPEVVKQHVQGVVADYLALGIDPKKANIYLQSDIAGELTIITSFLARHITVAELLRVPTLKDKLKHNANPETANALLLLYPVLMATDILINKSKSVPVGQDQLAHMEVTRLLARRFNKQYGEVFPIPEASKVQALRILSLKGDGKMSKTNPSGALFLTDDMKIVAKKIKAAETAVEGQMSDKLESHILVAKGLTTDKAKHSQIDAIITEHMSSKQVMGQFKELFIEIAQEFLTTFQTKREQIISDSSYIPSVLEQGGKIAKANAIKTLAEIKQAMGL